MPYINGEWYREWSNEEGDEWIYPLDNTQPFCITTVSSLEGQISNQVPGEGPYMAGINSYPYKDYTEIHCIEMEAKCPTTSPTAAPTPSPTIFEDPCLPATNISNMTLFVAVDASESIAGDNWDLSKQWIANVFEDAWHSMQDLQTTLRDQGHEITMCLRTSLILFSSKVETVWDLEAFGECYGSQAGMLCITVLCCLYNNG